MVASVPFRPIASAPANTSVEVIHGKPQAVTLARWDEQLQAWIRVGDPDRRALHRVTGWRTAKARAWAPSKLERYRRAELGGGRHMKRLEGDGHAMRADGDQDG